MRFDYRAVLGAPRIIELLDRPFAALRAVREHCATPLNALSL
jgi:hypothetical protein